MKLIANWKMHGSLQLCRELISRARLWEKRLQLYRASPHKRGRGSLELILCPPFPYIGELLAHSSPPYQVGAQYCSDQLEGPYTGEVSCKMLAEQGCSYVIVGHAERLARFSESLSSNLARAKLVQSCSMTPIFCLGEESPLEGSKTAYIKRLGLMLKEEGLLTKPIVIAYEPVWAIGKENSCGIEEIDKTITLLREEFGDQIPLIYGGAVNERNIAGIIGVKELDGVLVGKASLELDRFEQILNLALKYRG